MIKTSKEIGLIKLIWSNIEAGSRDFQLSTIWRIAKALNILISQIINLE